MMRDIDLARSTLILNNLSIVIVKNNTILFQSSSNGLAPFIKALDLYNENLNNSSIADKIVGRAAALLAIYAKIDSLYASRISYRAMELFEIYNISYTFGMKVKEIFNKKRTGICPFEESILNVIDPKEAYKILRKKTINFYSQ